MQREQKDTDWDLHPIQRVDDDNRVSLDTPEEGTTLRDLKSQGKGHCGANYSTLHLRDRGSCEDVVAPEGLVVW